MGAFDVQKGHGHTQFRKRMLLTDPESVQPLAV